MIAITNGKVVTVTKGTFENGTVLVEDGKIKAAGAGSDPGGSPGNRCKGRIYYPRPDRLPYPYL